MGHRYRSDSFFLCGDVFFSEDAPFFSGIHTEAGLALEGAFGAAVVYSLCVLALHAAVLSLSYVVFLRTIKHSRKRKKLFFTYMAASSVLLEAVNIGLLVMQK